MGGVDLADMLIELYGTDHKSKRWYMRIFYWMMDVSIVNGWLLYKRHCAQLSIKRRLSLLAFRMQIAQTLTHLKSNPLKRRSGMAAEAGIVHAKHLIHSPVTPGPTVEREVRWHEPLATVRREKRTDASSASSATRFCTALSATCTCASFQATTASRHST
ncbi:hypothetical protein MRX96_019612 [Rhipicephalus microplus]